MRRSTTGLHAAATLALALALTLTVGACSDALDPKTANLTGSVAGTDAATSRLLVNSGVFCTAVTAPCYDYDVRVDGRIYQLVNGRYSEITFAEVQPGSSVWAWGDVAPNDPRPTLFSASKVVVEPPDNTIYVRRAPR